MRKRRVLVGLALLGIAACGGSSDSGTKDVDSGRIYEEPFSSDLRECRYEVNKYVANQVPFYEDEGDLVDSCRSTEFAASIQLKNVPTNPPTNFTLSSDTLKSAAGNFVRTFNEISDDWSECFDQTGSRLGCLDDVISASVESNRFWESSLSWGALIVETIDYMDQKGFLE
jgi:hypothetical protein